MNNEPGRTKKTIGYVFIFLALILAVPSLMGVQIDSPINAYTIVGAISSLLGALIIPAIPLVIGLFLLGKLSSD